MFILISDKETGHGCFIIGCFGWSYSHSSKENNGVETSFKYDEGNIIEVKTSEDELVFLNETKKRQFRMAMKLTEKEWEQSRFCINLVGDGASVSILNE